MYFFTNVIFKIAVRTQLKQIISRTVSEDFVTINCVPLKFKEFDSVYGIEDEEAPSTT